MSEPSSDFTLLQGWSGGDKNAGNELVRRHFKSIYSFFRSKVSDRPEDLVQQAFVRCLESFDRYRESASFRAYLLGIARRILFEYFRSKKRDGRSIAFDQISIADLAESPSRVVALKREEMLLLQAMRRIPVDFQITIELFYWQALPIDEIAEVLDVRPGTIKSRLHRAKEMLKETMGEIEVAGELKRSTIDNLDAWAKSLQARLQSDSSE